MNSIAEFNNKSGAGQTTFFCDLGDFLGLNLTKKVLVFDADPQGNTTIYMFSESDSIELHEKGKGAAIDSFLDTLRSGQDFPKERVTPKKTERLGVDLIPGDSRLAPSEVLLTSD